MRKSLYIPAMIMSLSASADSIIVDSNNKVIFNNIETIINTRSTMIGINGDYAYVIDSFKGISKDSDVITDLYTTSDCTGEAYVHIGREYPFTGPEENVKKIVIKPSTLYYSPPELENKSMLINLADVRDLVIKTRYIPDPEVGCHQYGLDDDGVLMSVYPLNLVDDIDVNLIKNSDNDYRRIIGTEPPYRLLNL
ncbi:hypothetical protein [Vibrio maritimus]|uniref:hypothetical protein n=1 Tax=Vibrio maritimus TaxID=990268 RepID=UPI001F387D11|nr:hypothetical protein [Vibrio maritimus]